MALSLQPAPYAEAVERLAAKTPIASRLNTAEWAQMPDALRERAFWSAQVDDLRTVSEMQGRLRQALNMDMDPKTAFMSRGKFVADMRGYLGAPEGDSGRLTDLSSRRRLELVYDFQTKEATEYARWQADQDPDMLAAYPAQELIRVEGRRAERAWPSIWQAKGGKLVGGRMIALKSDPIWAAISRFKKPWPPFDFGSGMGLRDVDRAEAEGYGLIRPAETPRPLQPRPYNEQLQIAMPPVSPAVLEAFRELFGDQVEEADGKIRWKGGAS